MNKSEIFKKAHEVARKVVAIVGDYMVAFKYSLKKVYEEMKNTVVKATELNDRRNGTAYVNGFEITGLELKGSEKQVSWAEDIVTKNMIIMLRGMLKQAGGDSHMINGEELDAGMERINNAFSEADLIGKINAIPAGEWISNQINADLMITNLLR